MCVWQTISVCSLQLHGSHSQGNIIFQDISKTKLAFSRKKYTRFNGNKLIYAQKNISYLSNVWLIIDIFMVQSPPHPFLALWSTHYYLNFN